MVTIDIPQRPQVEFTPAILKSLKKIFGQRASVDDVDLETYAYDATKKHFPPKVVVWPDSADEISELMRLANEHKLPIYPRGGGTGLTGGSLALQGGLILSLERMSDIIEIDEPNRLVTAQPGISLGALKSAVQEKGFFYPPDPSSAKTAMLGGTLAECAGGLNCVKYGTTKDWVQNIKAVLPTGEQVQFGTKARKNVVGYNFLQLMIGSEGTLGIITEATLRLIPYPAHRSTFIALFDDVPTSSRAVAEILQSGITPSALEFIDKQCLEAAYEFTKDQSMPIAEALLLIECDGFDTETTKEQSESLAKICESKGAKEIRQSINEDERTKLWNIRRSLSPAMYAKATHKTNEDICVPVARYPDLLEKAYGIAEKYNVLTLCFGHAGDGNIHVNFMSNNEKDEDVDNAVRELFETVVKMEGSISGEHGIGITKAPYLALELGETERHLIKQTKALFDPNGILNPDKIIA